MKAARAISSRLGARQLRAANGFSACRYSSAAMVMPRVSLHPITPMTPGRKFDLNTSIA